MAPHENTSHWLQTAPAFAAPTAHLPEWAATVILGAGIMGSSTAYWLARRGLRPIVLERNAHPAGGATGRNGGLMVGGPGGPYAQVVAAIGREGAREIVQATETNRDLLEEVLAREGIAANYARPGFLTLAGDDAETASIQNTARELQADGCPVEWLDRPAAIEKMGTQLGPGISGALFDPSAGVIHSARYAFGVAQAAQRAGAYFIYNDPVVSVEPGPGGQGWRVNTAQGDVLADQLICTLNAWSGELFPELRRHIIPTRGHVVLTEPAPFRLTPWSANHGFEYGRQLEDGRLLVGGKRESRPDLDSGYAPPSGENVPAVEPAVVEALRGYIPSLFPEAANLGLTHHWTGVMAFSPDTHPLAGAWPGRAGLWLLLGFTGHGMPYSQVLPCALASQLSGEPGPAIPRAFDPARLLG